mmetsp:Transcript_94260/g.272363  ORF Transcript_94260/g.272363 Transcript_94260/m.272363 type:complete len:213 (-) Transcript_94260:2-640(-)
MAEGDVWHEQLADIGRQGGELALFGVEVEEHEIESIARFVLGPLLEVVYQHRQGRLGQRHPNQDAKLAGRRRASGLETQQSLALEVRPRRFDRHAPVAIGDGVHEPTQFRGVAAHLLRAGRAQVDAVPHPERRDGPQLQQRSGRLVRRRDGAMLVTGEQRRRGVEARKPTKHRRRGQGGAESKHDNAWHGVECSNLSTGAWTLQRNLAKQTT